ncbi:hypothetical protein BKA56DRAFT_717324 [Ilyonectria sp. MPI-CAGE-AT-0026]|nr:hypothetical protein BKA56DRAFT_717324 [Ilyonectria sp. MPI-CAGE-AT-0026]
MAPTWVTDAWATPSMDPDTWISNENTLTIAVISLGVTGIVLLGLNIKPPCTPTSNGFVAFKAAFLLVVMSIYNTAMRPCGRGIGSEKEEELGLLGNQETEEIESTYNGLERQPLVHPNSAHYKPSGPTLNRGSHYGATDLRQHNAQEGEQTTGHANHQKLQRDNSDDFTRQQLMAKATVRFSPVVAEGRYSSYGITKQKPMNPSGVQCTPFLVEGEHTCHFVEAKVATFV